VALATTLRTEWESAGDGDVNAVALLCSLICDVDEMRDVCDVVEFCDDQVFVKSAVDVFVVVMDFACLDEC